MKTFKPGRCQRILCAPRNDESNTAQHLDPQEDQPSQRRRHSTLLGAQRLPLGPALRAQQARSLEQRLRGSIDGKLTVRVTNNRSVMISVRRDARHKHYRLNVHYIFIDAPDAIMSALAKYTLREDPTVSARLSAFIANNDHRVTGGRGPARQPVIRHQGNVHDLKTTYDSLNDRYFGDAIEATVTWGRNAARNRRRASIRLGSYTVEDKLIRIHPGLDQIWVPDIYLAWVLYHEMLHVHIPIRVVDGRRRFHTPEFRLEERKFEHYETVRAWEQRNLPALLSI